MPNRSSALLLAASAALGGCASTAQLGRNDAARIPGRTYVIVGAFAT